MISINGAMGEGGGQILRSSLALSTCLSVPFRITNIRAARKRPGLQPQHLAAVKAAASISKAKVSGAERGSQELVFEPAKVIGGAHHFTIGTAGSTMLVLQTVLPALILADSASSLVLEGGTHNPYAPPFNFLQHVFLPLLNKMGPTVTATLERTGFAPKGGGRVHVKVQPSSELHALEIPERGNILEQYAEVIIANLPEHIAMRELAVIEKELAYDKSQLRHRYEHECYGPGNVVSVEIKSDHITENFTAFGQRGITAESVADNVVNKARRYLKAGVPVGGYLADQLLLPLALAGKGMFVTLKPSSHLLTNINVLTSFLKVHVQLDEIGDDVWKVNVFS